MTPASLSPDLHACLRGEEIAQYGPFPAFLSQFRALISAPPDTYADLYLTTLYRFMELCQSLPVAWPLNNQTTGSTRYGLLNRAFSLAIAALKIRRGRLMPQHSDSEKIAEQEPRWTYALLTAILFYAIPMNELAHYQVGLYKSGQQWLGAWHPLTGSLYESETFFKIEPEKLSQPIDYTLLRAAWVGRLIPAVAVRWLADSDEVFPVWWEAITSISRCLERNPLCQYFREAAKKLGVDVEEKKQGGIPPDNTPTHPAASSASENTASLLKTHNTAAAKTPLSAEKQALIRLIQWLNARSADLEAADTLFIRVTQGLLITEESLQRIISQYTMYASVEAFLKLLAEFLIPDQQKQSLQVSYRSIHFESREIRRGVVLAEAHLSEPLKQLPPCPDFIPDYSSLHSR
jgi:Putative helicase